MNISNKKSNTIVYLLYIVYLVLFLILNHLYDNGNSTSNIKYYLLSFVLFISFFFLLIRRKSTKKQLYSKENLLCILVAVVFIVISYFKAKSAGYPMSYRTFVQISQFVFPTLYAFNLINLLSFDSIIKLMKITLLALVFAYFLEPRHTIIEFLKFSNWKSINFVTFQSFTESHNFAESFLQLFLFFNFIVRYYHKENIEGQKYKKYMYIALIFTLFSFKRLGVLFALFIFFFGSKIDYKKEYNKKLILVLSMIFTLITITYTNLLIGNISTMIDLTRFTTNRNWFMYLWSLKDYLSYGYGTSLFVIGRYLEMDLVEIYMEMNVIALFIFIFSYFKITRGNKYLVLIMCYVFFNLITSSTMPWTIGWISLMITITSINSYNCSVKRRKKYE